MSLVVIDEMEDQAKKMRRMFNDAFNWTQTEYRLVPAHQDYQDDYKGWNPFTRTFEDDEKYEFLVFLPGVKKENIDVKLDGDFIVVSAIRNLHPTLEEQTVNIKHQLFGDVRDFEAEYKDGILRIKAPKVQTPEKIEPIKIEVK